MLRIYFLQQWFNLADSALEEVLYDFAVMRQFAGIDLGCQPVPGRGWTILAASVRRPSQSQIGPADHASTNRSINDCAGSVTYTGDHVEWDEQKNMLIIGDDGY